MAETITIPRNEYEALLDSHEQLADLTSVKAFLADPQPGLPSDLTKRMIEGEALLKLWRTHRGLTQAALAERSGVNRVQIAEIEAGRSTGSVATLRKLADALEVSLDALAN